MIAIIAILASMLLPALSKAREKVRAITCVNQLKQLGIYTTLYLDDQNYQLYSDHVGNKNWADYLGDYFPPANGEYWAACRMLNLYRTCPCYDKKEKQESYNTYGIILPVSGLYYDWKGEKAITEPTKWDDKSIHPVWSKAGVQLPPSAKFFLADSQACGTNPKNEGYYRITRGDGGGGWGLLDLKHGGKCNGLYMDMHVESISGAQPRTIFGFKSWNLGQPGAKLNNPSTATYPYPPWE